MDYTSIFGIAVSTVLAVSGWAVRHMYKKLEAVEADLENFKLHVVTYYVDKNDFKDAMRDIKHEVQSINSYLRTIVDKFDEKVDK